jgi:hypothetical protein
VATPLDALTVVVPDSVPLAGLVPIATVIDALDDVIVLPYWSCTVTVGDGEIVPPPLVLVGCCDHASLLAAAGLTVIDGLDERPTGVAPLVDASAADHVCAPAVVAAVAPGPPDAFEP